MNRDEMQSKIRQQENRVNLLAADVRRMENEARREGHMMEFLKGAVEGFMARFDRLEETVKTLEEDYGAWASTHDHPHTHDDAGLVTKPE